MKKTGTKTITRTLQTGRDKSPAIPLNLPIVLAIVVWTAVIGLSMASDGLFLHELTWGIFIVSALVLLKVSFSAPVKR
jgi:small neutral amino acid transporter SnatA (MarC family)